MGLEKDEYPVFKVLNRDVIKPAVKEINELTNFFVEVEQKRVGRRIGELKFKISRLQELPSVEPVQETFLFDIEDLPPTAIKLVQARRLTQRGTPDRQPRMGRSERCSTARGQRRFCCLC